MRLAVIVTLESHSPTAVDETAKDNVGGEPPLLPPPYKAPTATIPAPPNAAVSAGGGF